MGWVQITEVQWLAEQGLLVYVFDSGALLFYGAGVLPGTDIETYRFGPSKGFGGSREAYKEGQAVAAVYSRGLGFKGVQEHFESFAQGANV